VNVAVISNGNAFSTMMLRGLIEPASTSPSSVDLIGGLIVSKPPSSGRLALARRTGWRYAGFKGWSLLVPKVAGIGAGRPPTLAHALRARTIPTVNAHSANDAKSIEFLEELAPDILLSVSSPERFDERVLRVPKVAAINVHWAKLPAYGGIAPYFWMLRNEERSAGVTVHLMVPELDAGPILLQREVPIRPDDSVLALQLRLAAAGGAALREVFANLPTRLSGATEQDRSGRSYFTWPRPQDVRALRDAGRSLARPRDLGALARAVRSKDPSAPR
jgi:folate-dependent phosphoribosylglycinamide formyltransferase PurN